MLTSLEGQLINATTPPGESPSLMVRLNGMGFRVLTCENTMRKLPGLGEAVTVHTHLHVREDALTLIGFLSEQERDLFVLLQSASGVGVKMALAILSTLTVSEIAQAVVSGNHKALSVAKGVGPKLAQKIILDVKAKMVQWKQASPVSDLSGSYDSVSDVTNLVNDSLSSESVQEVESVLLSLGYNQAEVFRCLSAYLATSEKSSLDPESILQDSLRWLAQNT